MEEVRPLALRYIPRARRQLDAIGNYLHLRNERAAGRVGDRIRRACEQLTHHPYSGRPTGPKDARTISVPKYNYVVAYRVVGSPPVEIEVLGIFHTSLSERNI